MMTGTFGEFAASEVATSGFDIVTGDVVTAIAAGALMWTVYDRCDAWVAAFAIMAMVTAGGLDVTGASDMAGQMLGGGAEGVDVNTMDAIVDWVMSGLWVGVGALVATKIPDMV